MKKILKNAFGFGLVEVLMAAGLAGGIALTIAKLSQDANRVTKTTETNNEINMFMTDAAYILSDKDNCMKTIVPGTAVSGAPITAIKKSVPAPPPNDSVSVYSVGQKYGNGLFSLTGMQTDNSDGNPNLKITIVRNNVTTTGARSIVKKIPLKVVLAGGNITSCFSDTEDMIEDAAKAACKGNSAKWNATDKICEHNILIAPGACPNGQALKQITTGTGPDNGDDATFTCEPVSTTTCPAGQYLTGFDGTGTPTCASLPCGTNELIKKTGANTFTCLSVPSCAINQVLFTRPDGTFGCSNATCGEGQYLQGINSGGDKVCKSIPNGQCGSGMYVKEVKTDGSLVCEPVPAGANLPTVAYSFADGYDAGSGTWSRKTIDQTAQQICARFPTFTWNGTQCVPSTAGEFVTKSELASVRPTSTTPIHRSWVAQPWNNPNAGYSSPNNDWNDSVEMSVCATEVTLHSYTIPTANYARTIELEAMVSSRPDDSGADTVQFRFNVDSFVAQRRSGRSKDGWNVVHTSLQAIYTIPANTSYTATIYVRNIQGGCSQVHRMVHMYAKEL